MSSKGNAQKGANGGAEMKSSQPYGKLLCKTAAALLTFLLALMPGIALAEIDSVTGMDHWYLSESAESDPTDDGSIDVLAVTGSQGDRLWVDVTKNGNPIAKRLMYELNATEADANDQFVGVMSLDINDFAVDDEYAISAYRDRNDADDAAIYSGTVKPVLAVFEDGGASTTVVVALRTLGESDKDREFTLPEVLTYEGKTYEHDGEVDGHYRYVASDGSFPESVEGKVSFYELGTNALLKENTFTITKDEGSKLIPVDNIVESGGTYYRTLQLTGDVTAKYPGMTEFSVMCVKLDNAWGENAKPFTASFRYVDVDNTSTNLKDTDNALAQLLDKLIVTKNYTYAPPAYIYIKSGDVVEYWALVTDASQSATLDENGAITLTPTKDSTDQTIDIAYKKMDESFDAVWTVICVDATKGTNEAGYVLRKETFHVASPDGEQKFDVPQEINGLVPITGTEASYKYTYDPSNLISNMTIYYGVEGEDPTDSYDVRVNYVNVANNVTLRTQSYTITPDYVTERRYLNIPVDNTFVSGGNNYIRLSGQTAQIDHNYYNYDVVGGKKQKVYTIWYRDVNDDLHDNTVITTYNTVYDDVFVDRGVTTTTTTAGTAAAGTAAGGAAAGGAAAGGAAAAGTATLTDNGGLTGITTGGQTTLVRDDGTTVTGERIEDENNPLAAPNPQTQEQGDGATDAAKATVMNRVSYIIAAVAAVGGAVIAYLLLKKRGEDSE